MACAAPSSPHDEVPQYIQAWVRQLLDPDLADVLRRMEGRQIEVTLMVSESGKIRRRPQVNIDAGHGLRMIDPSDVGRTT